MTPRTLAIFAAGLLLLGGVPAGAGNVGQPVVVELFTSEGCSSCPPADALLGELAQRTDVLALAFHVDYWDYLGWTDRFADPSFTHRQKRYAKVLATPMVYTPQAVVDGQAHAVGSNRKDVERLIDNAKSEAHAVAVELTWTPEGNLRVDVPAAPYQGSATVWFVEYDLSESSTVTAGENAGRTLNHVNVVRELKAIGMWDGTAFTVTLPAESLDRDPEHKYGCAIIVQPEGLGRVLGAQRVDAAGPS
jgi:hypothetical protein